MQTIDKTLLLRSYGVEPVLSPDGTKMRNILTDRDLRRRLGVLGLQAGGSRGVLTEGDVITQTADGTPLNDIWAEFQQTIALKNSVRQGLVDFLSYSVTEPIATVPQFGGSDDFEVASEFGVPKSIRQSASYFQMGFAFEWYDMANRYTWKFLAEATAEQVESEHQAVLEADNRLVFLEVMRTLFRNTNRVATINQAAYNVYALYNADGTVPPDYKSNTFDGTHTHYLSSGAATVDSGDLDAMQDHLTHHGFNTASGSDLVLMVNKVQGDTIRNFRSIANGGTSLYDFIPAQSTPSFLLPTTLRVADGQTRPAATLRGLTVIGSYGEFTIVQEDYIPAGYMVAFATGGSASLTNPIGIREHRNASLRGLRLVKGRNPDYPLQDAIYNRGFGTGIRQRGGAVVMKITAGAYSIPTQYV